jgi:hypothetical protein
MYTNDGVGVLRCDLATGLLDAHEEDEGLGCLTTRSFDVSIRNDIGRVVSMTFVWLPEKATKTPVRYAGSPYIFWVRLLKNIGPRGVGQK